MQSVHLEYLMYVTTDINLSIAFSTETGKWSDSLLVYVCTYFNIFYYICTHIVLLIMK